MLYIIKIYSLFLILFFFNTSCVSVGIESPTIEKSESVLYTEPKNYIKFEQEPLDAAWKNPKNGNTISFLSECNGHSDPTYESIRDGILSGLRDVKIDKQEMVTFNNRQAFISTVSGSVDGVPAKLNITILKKNNCIFVITYVGLNLYFEDDIKTFSDFMKGFNVK
ncbi:MAG: hypothetical protein H6625_06290 [Bdellovibrionaceae bacterium]|nr:hypothetical protein [Pseudobdellovibrionaceae bacterium]